ncbi:MAG TPA: hypothetical protein VJN69_13475 [Candidatus Acidoferrales bacterium]|nr:hypothetical protein [Candidatus Acidoferrales bacterium]
MLIVRRLAPLVRVLLLIAVVIAPAHAQSGGETEQHGVAAFFSNWDARARRVEDAQPKWSSPVITSTSRIKQELRYDMSWQMNPAGPTIDNYGGSKGLTTIPFNRVEIDFNLPPYVVHNRSASPDGFGDFSFVAKFRIFSGEAGEGDYELTAFLGTTFPTGSHKNGSPHAVITPTIAGGKGIGPFVFQGTLGCDLPSAQTVLLGRRLILNNVLQYRRLGRFWPEIEVNSNFYNQGPNDGKKQVYVTPGVSAGHIPLHGRFTLTLDAGVEFAITHFHSAARQPVFSVRLPF